MSAGLISSLMQGPEMTGQLTWPSRAITLGPTTLATWLQQQSTSSSIPLTEVKGGIGILKDMPHCTRNNIPFLNDSRKMDMQKLMKGVKQHIYKQGSRSCAMLNSGKILPNVWFYSRTTLCNPRLTSPKS